MAAKPSIAVIGAGLGGLAASICLARAGARVTVYEQQKVPGGKAGVIREHGFRFDTGPSLLTMPFVLEDIFKRAGKDIEEYLTIKKLDVLCKYFFPDRTTFTAFADTDAFAGEIEGFSTDTAPQVRRYLRYCRRIYDRTANLFLFNDFRKIRTLINIPAFTTLLRIYQIDPFRTMHAANASFFTDPRIVQLFDRYATYNGSNPYRAPATLNIIQHVEYNLGGYIVKEGIHEIPAALVKIARDLGVEFRFDTPVKNILHKNGTITGLATDTTTSEFDCIVSNVDAGFTYSRLLGVTTGKDARRYFKREPSSSALVFYWGIRGTTESLDTHTVFFSKNYESEFNDIFVSKICHHDPTIYIYISARYLPSDAPPGHENWFVMINTPYNRGQNWQYETGRMRGAIIEKLSSVLREDIASKIVFERVLSPVSIERQTGSYHGSLYGISSNSRYAAFLRHPNKSRDWKRLYFCGGSTHPGGGIPLVLLSGTLTAERIIKDFGLSS
jgi:phytoene desaturase